MAEAAVKLVIGKLGSEFLKELGLVWGFRSDFENLQSVLLTIYNVLDDAERRSIHDKALNGWVRKLKDAALDADDVIDEFQYEVLRRQIQRSNQLIGKVSDFFSPHNQIAFRDKMAHKIKKINKRLDEIAKERSKFHLAEGSISERTLSRETWSVVYESDVFGRDRDKKKIINFLVGADDSSDVSVLPIVGLGGVGKTTLSQLAYNDQGIQEHFDLKFWVCISDQFSINEILNNIIGCEVSSLEAAQHELRTKLGGRRFLLVLDDVWNEKEAEWEKLKTLLRCGGQGSKILTTTRSDVVARIMGTVAPHRLEGLTYKDCWTLFKQRAFGPGREEETPRLVEIGKKIVEKCGGLPLAAKALGSLMSSRRREAEWLHIRDSELWRLPVNENSILPSLQLSYDHLPSNLKPCFAYCSIFPKDYEIDREATAIKRMELASSPIRNLVSITLCGLKRCKCLPALGHLPFLQDLNIEYMHAIKRIGMEFYGDGGIFPSLRRLHLWNLTDLEDWSTEATAAGKSAMAFPCLEYFTLFECPKLRVAPRVPPSVVHVRIEGDQLLSAVSTGGLLKLRNLTISHCGALSLPSRWEWMQDLTALTYLHICDDKLSSLPESILQLHMPSLREFELICTKLKFISGEEGDKQQHAPTFFRAIQRLKIAFSEELTALPEWLGSLTSLTILELECCTRLVMLPDGLQRLTALKRLWILFCHQLLARRCERDRGEDWPKIAHIPDIDIIPAIVREADTEENNQRSTTRLMRKLRLTSCMGHGLCRSSTLPLLVVR